MKKTRREFIRDVGVACGAAAGASLLPIDGLFTTPVGAAGRTATVAVCEGTDYYALLKKASDELGGLDNIIGPGDHVIVKPNIGWDRKPEYAANTNPEVVAAAITLCFNAGAGKVQVFDVTCDDDRRCYKNSGIAAAAEDAGAQVDFVDWGLFKEVEFPDGKVLKKWDVYGDLLKADVLVNVPIAKDHSLPKLTLGMKNLMGVAGGNRGKWHKDLANYLTDLTTKIRPNVTVVDATRILTAGGPTGGSLKAVKKLDKLIVSTDFVAADAYATTLFGYKPNDIGYVKEAAERGLGVADLDSIKTVEIV
jgi:uncharacterized protein (DUF362 family)